MASSIQQFPFQISLKTPSRTCSPNIRTFRCRTLKLFVFRTLKATSSSSDRTSSEPSSSVANSAENQADSKSDRVRLAFEKAREYKKKSSEYKSVQVSGGNDVSEKSSNGGSTPKLGPREEEKVSQAVVGGGSGNASIEVEESPGINDGAKDISEILRFVMEKAKGYKNVELTGSETTEKSIELPGSETGNQSKRSSGSSEKTEPRFTDIDFLGLDFSEKKKDRRGLPPGLIPVDDPYANVEMPEVEIIVGDASKFGKTQSSEPKKQLDDTSDLQKPKVSTWRVSPQPSNTSKTYGDGRNLHPGEPLETPEVMAVKEAHARKKLVEYRTSIGLHIDPKIKAECEKALKEGDALMDVGKLEEALPFYQKVMDNLVFQTELHGLAALQWSICLDSLGRHEVAQPMYKKLQSHPNAQVSKRAGHFVFSFEAMGFMKL